LIHQVDNEIERRLQVLISKGELANDEGASLRDKLLSIGFQQNSDMPEEQNFGSLLNQHGVPTQSDIDRLNEQLEALSQQLDGILEDKRTTDAGNEQPVGDEDGKE
jgi:polyhydroxyalkanoate synthesis regulator phasin